jgi:tripartite-type tricarboxylate transporter receptor subunit TctC
MKSRRSILRAAAAFAVAFACSSIPAAAQLGERPITIVVPFAPGGASDITARVIGQEISKSLGTPVIVENKAGANSQIGTAYVIKAAADGHTLLMGTTSLVNNVHLYPNLPYDASRGLTPVIGVVDVPAFLIVGPRVKQNTAKEFMAAAARSGDRLFFTSAGAGSTLHLASEWFKSALGFKAQHVPMKGSGPAVTALARGEADFSFENLGPAQPQIEAGRIRVLAIAAPRRFPTLPNVPTLAEAGLPSNDLSSWFGLLAPAGTPPQMIETINREVNKALAKPEVRQRLIKLGLVPLGGTPQQFEDRMRQDSGKWGAIIRDAAVKLD